MTRYQVGYLVGSLATGSINRKLARALIKLAPEGMEFKEIPFKDLPLYSYDYDDDFPQVARDFKAASRNMGAGRVKRDFRNMLQYFSGARGRSRKGG